MRISKQQTIYLCTHHLHLVGKLIVRGMRPLIGGGAELYNQPKHYLSAVRNCLKEI